MRRMLKSWAAFFVASLLLCQFAGASYIPSGSTPGGACGGDTSGTYPNCTVAKINGTTVPAGGALSTGNVLQVNGAGSATYAPITNSNLTAGTFTGITGTGTLTAGATGAGFTVALSTSTMSGTLPLANLVGGTAGQLLVENAGATAPAWVTLSNDCTITAAGVITCTKLNGGTSGTFTAASGDFLALGVNPSATGQIRGSNAGQIINVRNAGNSADLRMLLTDGSNNLYMGFANDFPSAFFSVQSSYVFQFNNAAKMTLNTTGLGVQLPISGLGNLPLQLGATAGALSVASPATLSSAQEMTPLIQLTGTAGANLITVANTVGGTHCFDFTGVTMGASSVKVGTGSGTQATIVAAALVGGLESICCHVYASNFVSCGGG